MRRTVATITATATLLGGALVGAAPALAAQDPPPDAAGQGDHVRPDRRAAVRAALERVADVVGLPLQGLVGQLRGGASMAEVAERQGVPTAEVVEAILAPLDEKLAAAVADGRIDEEQAAAIEARLTARAEAIVERHFDGHRRRAG